MKFVEQKNFVQTNLILEFCFERKVLTIYRTLLTNKNKYREKLVSLTHLTNFCQLFKKGNTFLNCKIFIFYTFLMGFWVVLVISTKSCLQLLKFWRYLLFKI